LEDKKGRADGEPGNLKKGIVNLLMTTLGYLVYVVVAQLFCLSGWSALLPHAIGMVIGVLLLTYNHKPFNK
ncbi:GRP family sugar transporter, partial [Lysinibacillus sp. D4A1_S13]|uniref:GRP family sugar transporter n=1 Tax=Lysinibacillus sp. D4A1_S13 TaxID=2941228 RepID=UPI0020BE3C86